jgi:hypothetical protein
MVADLPVRPLNILYDSIKAVPAVKYAFGVVGMAAAAMLVTGFLGADWPKIITILLGAMALLFVFSLLTRSASKVKYAAEFLCWTVVIGVAAVALGAMSFIVSGEPHRLGVRWVSPAMYRSKRLRHRCRCPSMKRRTSRARNRTCGKV